MKKMKKAATAVVAKGEKPASKLPLVDSKLTDKVKKCQANLEDYFKKNKLDPTQDWSKDKKHGQAVKDLIAILNTARKKVEDSAPKEIHHSKSKDKKEAAEKAAKASKATTYDYPKVDGREMTAGEKKKYRIKMRKEKEGGTSKKESPKAVETKKAKVAEVPAKAEKAAKPIAKKKFKFKAKKNRNED